MRVTHPIFIPPPELWPQETPTGAPVRRLVDHEPGRSREEVPRLHNLRFVGLDMEPEMTLGRVCPPEHMPLRAPYGGRPPVATFELADGWVFKAWWIGEYSDSPSNDHWQWDESSGYLPAPTDDNEAARRAMAPRGHGTIDPSGEVIRLIRGSR